MLPLRTFFQSAFAKPHVRRAARYQLLAALAKRWELRLYHHYATWYRDEAFRAVIAGFPGGGGYTAKRFNLYHLAQSVANLDGDTVECGVASGITSYLICHATQRPDRLHHGFDSFQGLPEPDVFDQVDPDKALTLKKGDFSVSLEQVQKSLSAFDRVRLYAGWIPDRFDEVADREFAFVHIDVDFYQPTLDALAFFYPRIVAGGMLVCDDYGYLDTPGASKAMDEFFADKSEPIVKLTAGHALVLKVK